jgi:hypothetical protein
MGATPNSDNPKRNQAFLVGLPSNLPQQLRDEFEKRYKQGRKRAFMRQFQLDWSNHFGNDPPADQTVWDLLKGKRDNCEYWFIDGLCQLLLGCSFNEWGNQYQPDQSESYVRDEIAEQVGERISGSEFNPFGITGRITKAADFFDREELLRLVFEELTKGCNLSLVGEPQIGKSSILWMVYQWGAERLKPPPDGIIYLDLQTIHDENAFFEELCYETGVPTERKNSLARELRGRRYILCLDEMEVLTDEECFPPRVRSKLRGLSDGADAPFKLVTASRSSLAQLFPDSPKMRSPLDIPPTNVLPFSREVAENFLKDRLNGTGITFTPAEIDDLLEQSGCYPAKLQRAAADLFNRYWELNR